MRTETRYVVLCKTINLLIADAERIPGEHALCSESEFSFLLIRNYNVRTLDALIMRMVESSTSRIVDDSNDKGVGVH